MVGGERRRNIRAADYGVGGFQIRLQVGFLRPNRAFERANFEIYDGLVLL